MDSKSIGKTIANLRKRCGFTQAELAEKLNVSNKAVSKWESGQGYPDISLFPLLSALFGVSIDYLMLQRKGIAVAGNIIADVVKTIKAYPGEGQLAKITGMSLAVGGCAPNVAIDLAKIDPQLSVSVCGSVGSDEYGRFVLSRLQKNGINVDGVSVLTETPTSFTDVMSVPGGERTFFHVSGANSKFAPEHINLKSLNCDILHIGYILLLDEFDKTDSEYGTKMAGFLKSVQEMGILTSVDMVSDNAANYGEKVIPALKYCDYLIVNELEICGIFGINPRDEDGAIVIENIRRAMTLAAESGVSRRVIVHAKEISFLYNVKEKSFVAVPSLKIPKNEIKGSVGAGDAFCAGALYGLHNNMADKQILEFASAAAACNLFAENSVDGMRSADEIKTVCESYERIKL